MDDLRASFVCLVSCEILTGRSSGEKAALAADAEPDDDWFDSITELVQDWSGGVELDSGWLGDVKLENEWWCGVFELLLD